MLDAMRAMGAPAEDIERVAQAIAEQRAAVEQPPEEFGIYRDNWPVVTAWRSLETQWHYAGVDGIPKGLNYACALAWLDMFVPQRQRRKVMVGLMVMERGALAAMNEIREQSKED
ncbi:MULTISPECIES: DUF1799 domain-containing protein [unclassified Delftia]|uniref:DUF1799 domain-containing protein n=1 Tax=unclassified Delftia TaxID=2613839 RepID=UPI001900AC04|nr:MULTISPECIES: DUF1799 domain-containing protein [unclassified Delftia]MBK0115704.1 DUF1799 domain-containing protein [Delftia sp. S65]MBK0121317.1 DUF1799 domain-containing protein [Delftia sp. S67]MBK0133562.1 DUF1799 domain-containing protein [Delftia sp. S66]